MIKTDTLDYHLPDDTRCWQAVVDRDASFDGVFVLAVRSTRIYCRPSCPSRKPKRENVAFFPVPEAAEQAGFRACKRCRPREIASRDPQAELTRHVCEYIAAHLDQPLTLDELGAQVNVSPFHLQRTFKSVMGITPRQYAEACRIQEVKARLREGDSVTGALYDAGFGSSSHFYTQASASLGMTPGAYRRGGQGMTIHYTIVDCTLGRLLVGATEKGLCAVSLSDNDAVLESALRKEYPAADITRNEGDFNGWVSAILDYLNGWQPHLDLPLDLQATAFQRRVWQALQAIPYGETRSYSQIAQSLGNPKAARAVARACATNPVAMVIPCHRVVREDGDLGGYRWGLDRKTALLKQEQNGAKTG